MNARLFGIAERRAGSEDKGSALKVTEECLSLSFSPSSSSPYFCSLSELTAFKKSATVHERGENACIRVCLTGSRSRSKGGRRMHSHHHGKRGDFVFFCPPQCCLCPPERRFLARALSPFASLFLISSPQRLPSLYSFTGPSRSRS